MEQQIEQEIQAKGLNAPRLTPEMIDSCIVGETYTILPSVTTFHFLNTADPQWQEQGAVFYWAEIPRVS